MDQDAYRKTYEQINERACLFEKCLFAGHAGCSQSEKFNLAEREGIHCKSDSAQSQCADLLNLLRHHSRFVLKASHESSVLNHAQALRIQVGGLRGLDQVMEKHQEAIRFVPDIHTLVSNARQHYGTLDSLPFDRIIQQVAAFKGRRG
ncbi:hypothetical protein [Sedimenticola selenatireducens]|uniref:Uncharacterized protein n=1 Tax=Sedimenticola selenatireducens TaxID=191960 RepID=A0A2N6CVG7_9GAMM|nr:hypothetical protein [Sedimenticola selenatireducens]PLX61194.1 MAG: hypothetical protein C0630_12430 [Sedimenticola selenatireducens]